MRKMISLVVILLFFVMAGSALAFYLESHPTVWSKIMSAIFGTPASAIPPKRDSVDVQMDAVIVSACTFAVSAISAIFTVLFGWRKDRREAKEFKLKIAQLEQQVAELNKKTPTPEVLQTG
jgi:hypothetical protein